MLCKQETGLAGQETEHNRTGHRVYNTEIQQVRNTTELATEFITQ